MIERHSLQYLTPDWRLISFSKTALQVRQSGNPLHISSFFSAPNVCRKASTSVRGFFCSRALHARKRRSRSADTERRTCVPRQEHGNEGNILHPLTQSSHFSLEITPQSSYTLAHDHAPLQMNVFQDQKEKERWRQDVGTRNPRRNGETNHGKNSHRSSRLRGKRVDARTGIGPSGTCGGGCLDGPVL